MYFFSHQKVQPSKQKRRIPCHNLWVSWFHNIYIHLRCKCIWHFFLHSSYFVWDGKNHSDCDQDLFRKCCWWNFKSPGACWSKWLQIYCNFCPSWIFFATDFGCLKSWSFQKWAREFVFWCLFQHTTSWKKKKPNQPNQTKWEWINPNNPI